MSLFQVIRFYSFWKTCTSFHRIVTMIDKVLLHLFSFFLLKVQVSNDDRHVNPDFKKRLFVQYLWRNAKAVEKARVQKEFDPRRQRLLRFVTDPNARKRFNKMWNCRVLLILFFINLYLSLRVSYQTFYLSNLSIWKSILRSSSLLQISILFFFPQCIFCLFCPNNCFSPYVIPLSFQC